MVAGAAFVIKGIESVIPAFQEFSREAGTNIPRGIMQYVATVAEQQAQVDCPVLTGHLRSTIHKVILSDLAAVVMAEAEYAAYVEYGTSRMQAQPFLEPAFRNSERIFAQLYVQRMQEAWQKICRKYSVK
jgi:HK97 gp10 family phage protein